MVEFAASLRGCDWRGNAARWPEASGVPYGGGMYSNSSIKRVDRSNQSRPDQALSYQQWGGGETRSILSTPTGGAGRKEGEEERGREEERGETG